MTYYARIVSATICLIVLQSLSSAQAPASKAKKPAVKKAATEVDPLAEARRTMASSLLTSLGDELSGFSGEDGELTMRVEFKSGGAMTNNFKVDSFDLTDLFTSLAKEDFNRAADLPKGFTGESPRAVAMLAVARTVLNKKQKVEPR